MKTWPTRRQYIEAIKENLTPDVTLEQVLSRSRLKSVVSVRRAAWIKLRNGGASYPGIANISGYDHSNVSAVVNHKPQHRERFPEVIAKIDAELRELGYKVAKIRQKKNLIKPSGS